MRQLNSVLPGADPLTVLANAWRLYIGAAAHAKQGYTKLELVNPKSGERAVYSGPLLPE